MNVAAQTITKPETVTNSSMTCFKACRQKYYWAYELGWRPDTEKAVLRVGSMVHEGIDLLTKDMTMDEVLDIIYDMYESVEEPPLYEKETVCCLITGYAKAWSGSQVKILESETVFVQPIINPNGNPMTGFKQTGKRDRIGRLPDSRIALMETKTCGEDISPDSDYRRVLAINQQLSMYINAAKAEGIEIETALYDCVRKPTIRPCSVPLADENGIKIVLDGQGDRVMKKDGRPRQTGDTAKGYTLQSREMTPAEWREKLLADIDARPEFYFQRFEVPRMESDLEEFSEELWMVAKDILECRTRERWYRNTSNCRMYNSLCPYYQLCAKERDISNGCPEGYRVAESVHEELVTQ